jgi:hypothetical protein
MHKSLAWLLGGLAGIATFGILPIFAIGVIDVIANVIPDTVGYQEKAIVITMLASLATAVFVSNWVTKRLARPNGTDELQNLMIYLRAGIRPLPLFRDIIIILALSAHYGLITGLTTFEVEGVKPAVMTIAATNLLSMLVGSTIAGNLTAERRWTHLGALALLLWLFGLLNVVLLGSTLSDWMASAPFILIALALGGSIATLLARHPLYAPPLSTMPQEIEFICEHCGERLAIAANLAGRRVACGNCGKASHATARSGVPVHATRQTGPIRPEVPTSTHR